ncbi:MAG: hypothetical protein COA94_07240 [Rickettsiales bacterium]|nr:MAG: hypothetical protein COA94_07240 [Rickettsiales bacterium]
MAKKRQVHSDDIIDAAQTGKNNRLLSAFVFKRFQIDYDSDAPEDEDERYDSLMCDALFYAARNEQDEAIKILLNAGYTDISGLEHYSGYKKIRQLKDEMPLPLQSVDSRDVIYAAQDGGNNELLLAFVSSTELQIEYDSDAPEDEDERYDSLMCEALWHAAFNEQDEAIKILLNGGYTDISGLEHYSGYKKIRAGLLEELSIKLFTAARSGRNLELLSELVQSELGFSESELRKVIEDMIEIAAFNSQQGALTRLLEGSNIDVSSFGVLVENPAVGKTNPAVEKTLSTLGDASSDVDEDALG